MPSDRIYALKPYIAEGSRILLLGSMPSVRSLESGFYYMHRQNRMWQILSSFVPFEVDDSVKSRMKAADYLHLSFSDVIASCVRQGSLDSAIRDYKINDINAITDHNKSIVRIITAGSKAQSLFKKHIVLNRRDIEVLHLPSTSPANTRFSLESLKAIYKEAIVIHDN